MCYRNRIYLLIGPQVETKLSFGWVSKVLTVFTWLDSSSTANRIKSAEELQPSLQSQSQETRTQWTRFKVSLRCQY